MTAKRRVRRDVVVVGARAAGSATAMLLARLGHDVVVVDRAELPSDTISTHQIARTGVLALHRWGLLDGVLASGAPALRQVTFHVGSDSTSRPINERFGIDYLVAPRRYVLDSIVAAAAVKAGAALHTRLVVTGVVVGDDGRVGGVHGYGSDGEPVAIESRFVVGADGLSTRVARAVGARVVDNRGGGGSTMYAYYSGLPWAGIEHYYGERGLAGIFPTHDGQACIWVCTTEADALELTCALVGYPPVPEFVELMRRLGRAIDTEAAALAARSVPGEHQLCPA